MELKGNGYVTSFSAGASRLTQGPRNANQQTLAFQTAADPPTDTLHQPLQFRSVWGFHATESLCIVVIGVVHPIDDPLVAMEIDIEHRTKPFYQRGCAGCGVLALEPGFVD